MNQPQEIVSNSNLYSKKATMLAEKDVEVKGDIQTSLINYWSFEDIHYIVHKTLNSSNFTIDSYQEHIIPVKKGFLGEYSSLSIKVSAGERLALNFFVKKIPKLIDHIAVDSGALLKEHSFFTKLVPQLKSFNIDLKFIPKCILSKLNEVLVLEDLSLEGFRTLSPRVPYTLECVLLVLERIAQMHASFIALEENLKKTHGNKYRLIDDNQEEFQESFYYVRESNKEYRQYLKTCTRRLIEFFTLRNKKEDLEKLSGFALNIIDNFINWTKPSNKFKNVFVHGDLWSNNLMLKTNGSQEIDCKIIDFQSYRYLPPCYDVLSFLYLCTDRQFRQEYLMDCLSIYYENLKEILHELGIDISTILTFGDFLKSYAAYKEFIVVQCVTYYPAMMRTKFNVEELRNDVESEFVINECNEDEIYRRRLEEIYLDLLEVYQNRTDCVTDKI